MVEMTSYLRSFALLETQEDFYSLVGKHVIQKFLDQFVKVAFSAKGNQLRFMKGERKGVQLPLDVFLQSFKRDLLEGAL